LGSRRSQITISLAYEIYFAPFLNVRTLIYKTLEFANTGLCAARAAPLLRITKPAGGAGDTFQGLVEIPE